MNANAKVELAPLGCAVRAYLNVVKFNLIHAGILPTEVKLPDSDIVDVLRLSSDGDTFDKAVAMLIIRYSDIYSRYRKVAMKDIPSEYILDVLTDLRIDVAITNGKQTLHNALNIH